MITKIKPIIKYFYTFIILIIIYILLGVATSLIPKSLIEENSKKSAEYLANINHGVDIIQKDTFYKGEYIFNYTNALMLNTAYSIDTNKPLESFLLARENYIVGETKTVNKDETLYGLSEYPYRNQTEEYYNITHNLADIEAFEYARYWHGYLVILRPMLILFSYDMIEKLSITFFIILLGICTYLISKKINKVSAILFLLSFIIMNLFYISGSINEITCFIIMLCANIYILINYSKIKKASLVFFIIGSITSFLDLLTNPLITIAIPLCIYMLLKEKEKKWNLKERIIEYLKILIAWLMGYGLTWFSKWLLVDIMYNRNLIEVALKQMIYRMQGKECEQIISYGFVISNNMRFLGKQVLYMTVIISIIIMLIGIIKNKGKLIINQTNITQLLMYLAISLLPFIWYFVLKNHSAVHARFTHRLFIISIFAFWTFLAKFWGVERKKE